MTLDFTTFPTLLQLVLVLVGIGGVIWQIVFWCKLAQHNDSQDAFQTNLIIFGVSHGLLFLGIFALILYELFPAIMKFFDHPVWGWLIQLIENAYTHITTNWQAILNGDQRKIGVVLLIGVGIYICVVIIFCIVYLFAILIFAFFVFLGLKFGVALALHGVGFFVAPLITAASCGYAIATFWMLGEYQYPDFIDVGIDWVFSQDKWLKPTYVIMVTCSTALCSILGLMKIRIRPD